MNELREKHIEQVVAQWSGIPMDQVSLNDRERLQNLQEKLNEQVVGQQKAVETTADTVKQFRTDVRDRRKPPVLMFVGPSGVGKTELAKSLSEVLFGDENGIVRLDMSEFGDRYTASRLTGSPPGYVGHGEGGELTEAVKRQPHSIVLLDEIEKAHQKIHDLLLQAFDEGRLTDSRGRTVNFSNVIFIMTSNLGNKMLDVDSEVGFRERTPEKQTDEVQSDYREAVRSLPPEFCNRIDETVVFNHLEKADVHEITRLKLEELTGRLESSGYDLEIDDPVVRKIANEGYDINFGARNIQREISRMVQKPISTAIVQQDPPEGSTFEITLTDDGSIAVDVVTKT